MISCHSLHLTPLKDLLSGAVLYPTEACSTLLQGFIFTWLIGYSVLLGPVGGVLLADYYFVKCRLLDVNGLYSADSAGPYWYKVGHDSPQCTTACCWQALMLAA